MIEFTHEQMSEIISTFTNKTSGFQDLVKLGIESLMKNERTLHNQQESDSSNGFRDRKVYHQNRVFEIKVPRTRESNFYPVLLGILKDQETELNNFICSLYTAGLTTSQIGDLADSFFGKHYSKSQISRLTQIIKQDIDIWLARKLERHYPIIFIDATFVLTKRDNSASNEAYYTILGVKEDKTREVLSIVNFPMENSSNWMDLFNSLKERGVESVALAVSDGLSGIENSISKSFPMADIQLCTVHLKRNIINKVKPKDKQEIAEQLQLIFKSDQNIDCHFASENFNVFIRKWQSAYPQFKRYLEPRYRLYFTYFKYEKRIRSMINSTNWIERLNRDYKRVLKMRGAMPNPQSVIFLMGNVAQGKNIYSHPLSNFASSNLFIKNY